MISPLLCLSVCTQPFGGPSAVGPSVTTIGFMYRRAKMPGDSLRAEILKDNAEHSGCASCATARHLPIGLVEFENFCQSWHGIPSFGWCWWCRGS